MEQMNLTQARNALSRIVTEGLVVEVSNPHNQSVIVPKPEWEALHKTLHSLEKTLIQKEMEEVLARQEKKYSTEEVGAMLREVLGGPVE